MLPQENRLKKKKEFETVFKNGTMVRGETIFVKYFNNNEKTRIGFVVSKKVSKLAVERNKVKRRLREIFRKNKQMIKEGVSLIVVASPNLKNKKYKEIEQEVLDVLKKGGLINKI